MVTSNKAVYAQNHKPKTLSHGVVSSKIRLYFQNRIFALFTIKAGPVVHYSNMSARQIAESPKFGAVSGDEVIDFVVPKEKLKIQPLSHQGIEVI